MRSPTAEHMLQGVPGYAVKSAGVDPSSRTRINKELVAWADRIFVRQRWHRLILEENVPKEAERKQIICLHVPDEYVYLKTALIRTLKAKLSAHIKLPESG